MVLSATRTSSLRISDESIKIGTLILMVDERYPPAKWPLARVVSVHPGDDGLIRGATVRTASSTFKRPVTKLCALHIDKPNAD